MSLSPYLRALREQIGTARLLLPSVTALLFDEADRLLLVRQREEGIWSTPGGFIEPEECPADAVVREMWEETGLLVTPQRIAAVFGGPEFVVHYPNEDEAQYVTIVFDCTLVGGQFHPDGEETTAAAYWSLAEASGLPLAPWLVPVLSRLYERGPVVDFEPARWHPPASTIAP